MKKYFLKNNYKMSLMLIFFLTSCELLQPTKTTGTAAGISSGEASYYANSLHGRATASGEIYDKNKLTAAHKTLPFQTKVEVENLKNGKKVIVRINDRMPSNSKRSIDLSEAAAKKIDMIQAGVVSVKMKIIP
jgi:rare lipoprotein A